MFAKEYTPTHRGFDSHYGYYQGAEGYFDHTYEVNDVGTCISSFFHDCVHDLFMESGLFLNCMYSS